MLSFAVSLRSENLSKPVKPPEPQFPSPCSGDENTHLWVVKTKWNSQSYKIPVFFHPYNHSFNKHASSKCCWRWFAPGIQWAPNTYCLPERLSFFSHCLAKSIFIKDKFKWLCIRVSIKNNNNKKNQILVLDHPPDQEMQFETFRATLLFRTMWLCWRGKHAKGEFQILVGSWGQWKSLVWGCMYEHIPFGFCFFGCFFSVFVFLNSCQFLNEIGGWKGADSLQGLNSSSCTYL